MTIKPVCNPSNPDDINAAIGTVDFMFNGNAKGAEKRVGIVMLWFPYGASDGQANYASNGANREDIVKFLRETADRLERKQDVVRVPTGIVN